MNQTFSPQPPSETSYDSHDGGLGNITWRSHEYNFPQSPLNVTYSPGMDRTYSGTDHSFSSGSSYSPISRRSPPASSTPQQGSQRMNRTFSPQRDSPSYFKPDYSLTPGSYHSSPKSSPRMDRSSSPGSYGTYDHSDRTFSDRTYSGSDQISRGSSADINYLSPGSIELAHYLGLDTSLEDEVFEPGVYPMSLQHRHIPGVGGYRHLTVDRGFYPAQMEAGADYLRRDQPETMNRLWYPKKLDATPSPQPVPRVAEGTVRMSPHTPAISRFSRFGYTDPQARILNIPPGDDLDISTGMKRAVTITSPGKQEPLHLNVQVTPKSISQSPGGNEIICDIAIGVEEAVIHPRFNPYFTPPVTETVRRYDRKHGMFTPRSIFKRGYQTVRNIFDVSPRTPSPRPPPLNTTIEWEHDYLNRLLNRAPLNADLNRTFTMGSSPGSQTLNRTFDVSSPTEAYGYRTPSYQEPAYPAWTYPRRKNAIPVSPEQDLIAAVEDYGFDYDNTPTPGLPHRYYAETR